MKGYKILSILLSLVLLIGVIPALAIAQQGAYEIVAVRPIPDNITFPDGDTLENNVWTRLYESELGINLTYEWMTPVAQYEQKLNLSLTTGRLPDVFQVNAAQLKQLVDDEMLASLSDVYESTASEYTKDVLTQDGGSALASATFAGKLMAVPKMGSGIGNTNVLWIRTEWLQALDLEAPKTMADVIAIATAFAKNDPDGNGQDDTYGLALNKDLYGMAASLEGFMNGFGGYPNIWVDGEEGRLENGAVQPEVKTALAALQALYQEGAIDPEFGTKDGYSVINGDAGQGKVGMFYGYFWNMGWLTDAKTGNEAMDWSSYALVGEAEGGALAQVAFPVNLYYVVSADCEHPEAILEMLNLQLDRCFGENAQPDVYNVDSEGRAIFEYPLIYSEPPMKNANAQKAVAAALASGDVSELDAEQKGYYEQVIAYRSGERAEGWAQNWAAEKMWGEQGSMAVINQYVDGDRLYHDRYFGTSTESMADFASILIQKQAQVFTEIIQGADIARFDQFVTDWYNLGGKQITDDVNLWNSQR